MRALIVALTLLLSLPATAQDAPALARFDPARSLVSDAGTGLAVEIGLSTPVPWRAFTLDAPPRLVVDFRELDWSGARRESLLNADRARDLRFGPFRAGWSRLVVDLAGPLSIEEAGMAVDASDNRALVTVRLQRASPAAFAAASGAPPGLGWDADPLPPPPPPDDTVLTVVIDPGHGGIDPGAVRGDMIEAELVLVMAGELAQAVNAMPGWRAILTRQEDVFVPLGERVSIARAVGADAFVSLHADALEEEEAARGASIYTLSSGAGSGASARMAERHGRSDLLAGLDLSGQDDTIARALMDLARLETAPASDRLAGALVAGLASAGAELNSRPRRQAQLAVLVAADVPSVLVEAGFLSSESDRVRLTDPDGRKAVVDGLLAGLRSWAADRAVRAPLMRQ